MDIHFSINYILYHLTSICLYSWQYGTSFYELLILQFLIQCLGGGKTLLPQSNRLLTEHLSPIDFTRIAFSSCPSSIQTKSLSFHWNTVMRWMKKQVSINVHQFFLFNIYKIDICNVHIRKLTLVFITRISNQVQQLHHCLYQLGASG